MLNVSYRGDQVQTCQLPSLRLGLKRRRLQTHFRFFHFFFGFLSAQTEIQAGNVTFDTQARGNRERNVEGFRLFGC